MCSGSGPVKFDQFPVHSEGAIVDCYTRIEQTYRRVRRGHQGLWAALPPPEAFRCSTRRLQVHSWPSGNGSRRVPAKNKVNEPRSTRKCYMDELLEPSGGLTGCDPPNQRAE